METGGAVLCRSLSLSVPAATAYALLGKPGAGKTTLVRCIAGKVRPSEGRVLVFGEDPRRAKKRIALVAGETERRWRFFRRSPRADDALATAVARPADLLLLDEPAFEDPARARQLLAEEIRKGRTVFLATSDAASAALLAHRVGILAGGRLVLDEDYMTLMQTFRRIRYSNEMTETRQEYGNELDAFDAVSVKVRGWGIEAIVSDFDEKKFERFRAMDGVSEPRAEPLSLPEIFEAVTARAPRG